MGTGGGDTCSAIRPLDLVMTGRERGRERGRVVWFEVRGEGNRAVGVEVHLHTGRCGDQSDYTATS